jgi:hypothetical protein
MQTGLWVLDPSQAIGTGIINNGTLSDTKELSVFPNPVISSAIVDKSYSGNSFAVMDVTGRIHANGIVPSDGKLLETSFMIPGLYIVQIERKGHIFSCKFLKM